MVQKAGLAKNGINKAWAQYQKYTNDLYINKKQPTGQTAGYSAWNNTPVIDGSNSLLYNSAPGVGCHDIAKA